MAKNHNHNPEVISLADVLAEPVKGYVTEPEFFVMDEENHIENAEFEEPLAEETIDPEPVLDSSDFMPPQALAETIVNSLDGIQSLALPFLREMKVFTRAEREMIAGINTGAMYGIDTPEGRVLEKYKKHLKIVDKIPFSPSEQKRLKASFTTYIKLTDMKVTPMQGLMMSLGEVMLTRATYFINE